MQPTEAYQEGRKRLQEAWEQALAGESPHLPPAVSQDIASIMRSEEVSQRYALPTQVLLKLVTGASDSHRLRGIENIEGRFSARSFAKETLVALAPVGNRLGASPDPYVSQPLRIDRLDDRLLTAKNPSVWEAVLRVLRFVDSNPATADAVLIRSLSLIKDLPEQEPPTSRRPPAKPVDLTTLSDAIPGIDQDLILDIIDVLESDQPQVILAGPPGTSKTHVAVALAAYMTRGDESRYRVVQFHASYGYEEFVEGLRPTVDKGLLKFEVVPGVVRRMSQDQADEARVLVLDEMNRANLPRVLGELLYAIERRGSAVDLMYTQGFRLPKRLAFIGTMNTADRSIRSIDAAVRRRFEIFDFPPLPAVLREFYRSVDNEVDNLVEGFEELNDKLTKLLDRHHTIGHTFFMDARGMTASRLRQIWRRQVFPLIEEYLFDQPDLLAGFRAEALWPALSRP